MSDIDASKLVARLRAAAFREGELEARASVSNNTLTKANEAVLSAQIAIIGSIESLRAENAKLREGFDLVAHIERQRAFSVKTFGPGARTEGVVDHIRKELCEIEADPADISEWIDVILLALDGAWRAGWKSADICAAIEAKQTKNEGRSWPDWRTAAPGKAIEHDRTKP